MGMNPRLLRPTSSTLDKDAAIYLNAVAVADGQQLEPAVRKAVNDFVVGCKQDGIWDAIKASCILAGARTLAGALVPLKGAAPTNNGPFVAADYNRETGLLGNGSTKYLDSNRADNADPQNSKHVAAYVSPATVLAAEAVIGALNSGASGGSQVYCDASTTFFRANSSASLSLSATAPSQAGIVGCSRASASTLSYFINGAAGSAANSSTTPVTESVHVFGRNFGTPNRSDERVAFYSIGESLDLGMLDARVSALITAIGNAI